MSLIRLGFAAFLAVSAGLGTPAHAQDDDWLRLSPATPWTLDYAEDSCALRRVFGEEGQQVFMELRQFQPEGAMQLVVASKDIGRRSDPARIRQRRPITATFTPDDELDEHEDILGISHSEWGDGYIMHVDILTGRERQLSRHLVETQNVGLVQSAERREMREREITGLAVGHAFRKDIVLQTGSMHEPMEAMRTCLDELLTHWGLDAEAQRGLLRQVRAIDIDDWARELQQRYPANMLRRGQQAVVNVRLTVDEVGRASNCAVQSNLNDATFDELACELLLEHGRFEPALDGNGDPIESYWVNRVVYMIG